AGGRVGLPAAATDAGGRAADGVDQIIEVECDRSGDAGVIEEADILQHAFGAIQHTVAGEANDGIGAEIEAELLPGVVERERLAVFPDPFNGAAGTSIAADRICRACLAHADG